MLPGPFTFTVLLTSVVTVLAGPFSPGVKFGTTPGVLVKLGGGACAAVAGGALIGATVDALGVAAGACDTTEALPIGMIGANVGGCGGGGVSEEAFDAGGAIAGTTDPLSVDRTGCGALVDEFAGVVCTCAAGEALYAPVDDCAADVLALLDEPAPVLIDVIGTKAGPRPVQSVELDVPFSGMDEVAGIGPIESVPAFVFGTNTNGAAPPDETAELLFPAGRGRPVAAETMGAFPEPEPEGEEEDKPFIVKFAHVIIVLFA